MSIIPDLSFLDDCPPAAARPARSTPPTQAARVEAWDSETALRLMHAADGLVEQLGVPGTAPAIQAEAAKCVESHGRRDMPGVRSACAAVEDLARKLAAQREQRVAA